MTPNSTPSPVEKLVKSSAVCDALSISRATLYKAISSGQFPPPVKIGSASRWPLSAINAFIAARAHHPGGEQ